MARPSTPVACLLLALALLAPLAAMADACVDCDPAQGCCLASGCLCCLPGSSVLAASVSLSLGSAPPGTASPAPDGRGLAAAPRGVFHVPKSPLA
jgi:hypothetical protein